MATLSQIRTAVKTIVESPTANLKVYPRIPGTPTSRAAVLRIATADFAVTMGKGFDTWNLDLIVLLSTGDLDVAQQHLDEYIDGGGSNSIRAAVFATPGLGLSNTSAHIAGVVGYGPFDAAAYDHVGAILRLVVTTKPS